MERYYAAYRDPKSPLTPITPLGQNRAFTFELGGDNSLDHKIKDVVLNLSDATTPINTAKHAGNHALPSMERTQTRRYSKDFQRLLNIFEAPQIQITTCQPQSPLGKSELRLPRRQQQQLLQKQQQYQLMAQKQLQKSNKRRFFKVSPIKPKPISPRLGALLLKVGLEKYKPLFQREEIDMGIFTALNDMDLQSLGIINDAEHLQLLNAIAYARNLQ